MAPHVKAPLMDIGVAGKRVIQLCCNDGRELLSVRHLGAAYCVGVDQSRPFKSMRVNLLTFAERATTSSFY